MFLLSACTEDKQDIQENKGTSSTSPAIVKNPATVAKVTKKDTNRNNQRKSLMDKPVNFSTPEHVKQTLLDIRDLEGDAEFKQISSAMSYIMQYDLSVGGSKAAMYRKLDGKTPNEIIAKMKR